MATTLNFNVFSADQEELSNSNMPETGLLLSYGANFVKIPKDQAIFRESHLARFYYKVESGKIKMCNYHEDGKEFIQGIFEEGESFGEPPLFINAPYPADAIAVEDSVVLRLSRNHYFTMLKENPDLLFQYAVYVSERLMNKAQRMRDLSSYSPELRILNLLKETKKKSHNRSPGPERINLTRQEIANMTGLRVETVIRTMKALQESGKITIQSRKVYF